MKCNTCVHMVKHDRPILHRKTGVISVAYLQLRQLITPSIAALVPAKSPVASSTPSIPKQVHWAKPIKVVISVSMPRPQTKSSFKQVKNPKSIIKIEPKKIKEEPMVSSKGVILSNVFTNSTNDTPFYCFECQKSYSSPSKLNRHKNTLKHQQSIGGQSNVVPRQPTVAQPMSAGQFHCSVCNTNFSSKKHLNRHENTTKTHQDNLRHQQAQLQKQG